MATLESQIEVTSEKSDITGEPILREIPFKFSGIRDVDVLPDNIGVTVGFNTYVKMYINESEQKNIVIPAPTETLTGTLTLDKDTPVIELRTIPTDEARALILDYITEHHGAKTSDIIFGLALDVDLVLSILKEFYENEDIEMVENQ